MFIDKIIAIELSKMKISLTKIQSDCKITNTLYTK